MTRKTWSNTDISAYLDGELAPNRKAALEKEMSDNPALRRRVETMQEVVGMVRAVPLRDTPRNYLLTPSMVAETEPEQRKAPRRRPLFMMRLATSLVALAFVITSGMTLLQQGIGPAMVLQSDRVSEEDAPLAAEAPLAADDREQVEAPEKEAESLMLQGVTPEAELEEAESRVKELSPEEELALAPLEESGDREEGLGGGSDVPPGMGGDPSAQEEAETPMAMMEAPLESDGTPAPPDEDAAVERATAEEAAPAEDSATAEVETQREAPQKPEETVSEEMDRALPTAPADVVTPDTPTLQRTAESQQDSTLLLSLSIGFGVATLVLGITTLWMARRFP